MQAAIPNKSFVILTGLRLIVKLRRWVAGKVCGGYRFASDRVKTVANLNGPKTLDAMSVDG